MYGIRFMDIYRGSRWGVFGASKNASDEYELTDPANGSMQQTVDLNNTATGTVYIISDTQPTVSSYRVSGGGGYMYYGVITNDSSKISGKKMWRYSLNNRDYVEMSIIQNESVGTYIDYVISTFSSQYPSNGVHTDGYWYIRR